MDKKPFFSVIVPAHNSEQYLAKGLDSIKAQTFTDYELIVICDACTDRTHEIALEYADKILVTNHGMDGLARNEGIDAAEGKWILFMDDDDWFLHEYVFEELYRAIMDIPDNVSMLVFDFIWKGRGVYHNTQGQCNIAVWSKCWRREFIGDTRFPGIHFTSDEPFMQEIVKKQPVAIWLNQPMYYYNYMRKGSQTERHEHGN